MPAVTDRLRRAALGTLLPGVVGTTAPQWVLDAARDGLGGVVLFAHNTPDPRTTRALCDELHAAGPQLLVAVDEEGGDVSRLQADGSTLPGPAALGAVDDTDLTRRTGAALGSLLRAVGIDLDLAPVLDVAVEPRNPVIGVRSFGPDADLVARHGAAFVAGLQGAGTAACAKHFPGHGDTTVDSHRALPVLNVDLAALRERDLRPFAAAAAADAVMTGHLLVPALGPGPASLEPAAAALARELGLGAIITDALDMGALGRDLGLAAVQALAAGADLLCLGNPAGSDDAAVVEHVVERVVAAVRHGELPEARLTDAARRADHVRARLAARRATTPEPGLDAALTELTAVGAECATRAVRVEGPGRLTSPPVLLDLRRRTNVAAATRTRALAEELTARWPGTEVREVAEPGSAALAGVPGGRPVVVLVREPMADDGEHALLAEVLAHRPDAVVVHGGTADGAPAARTRVLAHGVGRANARAVVDVLTSGVTA